MIQQFLLRGRNNQTGVYTIQNPDTAPMDDHLAHAYVTYVLTSVPGFKYIGLEFFGGL
jgi:hypothetical protein